MQPPDDAELLTEYVARNSEDAFTELVGRHAALVYSAALRQVREPHLAEDVTQAVFILLARKARSMSRHVSLSGWLCRAAHFVSRDALRAERRRLHREQMVTAMENTTDTNWMQIAPLLDEVVAQLGDKDRSAIVLRYYEKKSLGEIGAVLGVDADAAQKRVSRALEKLRGVLSRRGVALSAVALTSVLATQTVTAAPVALAAGITSAALEAAAGGGTTLTFLKLMATTNVKSALVAALVVASLVTPLAVEHNASANLADQSLALREQGDRLDRLREENARLARLLAAAEAPPTASDERFKEVLRLRGESGRLQAVVQELAKANTNDPLSREEVLASMRQMYLDRINRIKQRFAENPGESVPELQYLTDRDWLELVEYDHHKIDPDGSRGMSSARGKAQIHFAEKVMMGALWEYGRNNNGQFPSDLSQLAPYFKSPVDDAVLQDWAIVPGTSLPGEMRVTEDRVITQKAPVNAAFDQRFVLGMKSMRIGTGPNQWKTGP